MKLVQRIGLMYYRIKFRALELLSVPKAAEEAFELFCTPYSKRKRYPAPVIFEKANKQSFEFQNHTIHGFHWKPASPNGYKLLICHGFDSNCYKFERYIYPLLNLGFEVFAFDAPAHGLSTGKTITALLYRDMILEANKIYGPFQVIIAHSFGGIAVALAIESGQLPQLQRLVLVAPATETTRSLNDFCRYLHISKTLKKQMENMIIQIEGKPSSWYSVGRIIQTITLPTLWLHDRGDTITPFEDMQHLTTLHLPGIRFHISQGLGHSLYREDNIAEEIISFISSLKS